MMKKYASLIRKLVDATAEAEVNGEDVVDILKERCFNDTDIVRRTLMNAVCDPRFKLYADVVGYWRDEARNALEQLAEQLGKNADMTEDDANYMLDIFLNAWLRMTFEEAKRPIVKHDYFKPEEEKVDVKEAIDFLTELEDELYPSENKGYNGKEYESMDVPNSQDEPESVTPSNESGEDSSLAKEGHEVQEQDNNDVHQTESQQDRGGAGNRPSMNTNLQRLEERYLQKIPPSLLELARRIGRMGDVGPEKQGRFLYAGKSDIAGITVGNDLSAVLPSELALLADTQTQEVFYHNYTARRLQLLASASQTKSPNKHQDGPVIICVDTSSSMSGEPIMVAKTLAVAVAIIAWRKNRDVIMVKYSDDYYFKDFGHNRSHLGEMSRFLSEVYMAGNNENAMFQWLFGEVKPTLPDYDTADILCVSDFGWCHLDETTKKVIEEQKLQGMRFYGLNVNSDNAYASLTVDGFLPMDICDSVWTYENGECKEKRRQE